ncbi:MAG: hypothetical protein LBI58_03135, partial [Tannerellaceae bacterium]|nr:hypothetical protein [Tannerellaceae bacterium]
AGKPRGQHGAEIRWCFSDLTTTDPDEMTNSLFATSSPHTITFHQKDYGKRLHMALRWEINRGQKGPWSSVELIHVP